MFFSLLTFNFAVIILCISSPVKKNNDGGKMSFTSTVTAKGQITLPKTIREFLDSRIVEIDIVGDEVRIRPVKDMGGVLAGYAKDREPKPLSEIREEVWEVADEGKR
jgi:AbrB family looped-hinge helix DNA binding protein